MIRQSDIIADMHTHTIFSDHAFSTLKENLECGKKQGLKYLAITDHYYNDGTLIQKKNETCRIKYMEDRINPVEKDIKIFGSAEFNLGQEIVVWDKLKSLKWRPIGLHSWFLDRENTTFEELYKLFEDASDKFNCFVHIERELHKIEHKKYGEFLPIDLQLFLESIVILAKKKDVYLEVNESSLILNDGGAKERLIHWLKFAKENGNKISLGSDAHYCEEVGRFENVIQLLNEVEYPKHLILNCNEELIRSL